jgi:hypothetical protein
LNLNQVMLAEEVRDGKGAILRVRAIVLFHPHGRKQKESTWSA